MFKTIRNWFTPQIQELPPIKRSIATNYHELPIPGIDKTYRIRVGIEERGEGRWRVYFYEGNIKIYPCSHAMQEEHARHVADIYAAASWTNYKLSVAQKELDDAVSQL